MSTAAATHDEAEIVVVGGGPAGSSTAAILAELGHDVLIVDKNEFPREKPCGDGLMSPAVVASERLGLGPLLDSTQEIEAIRIMGSHRYRSVARFLGGPGKPKPRCLGRDDFDMALLDAAKERGARFLRARVEGLDSPNGHRVLTAVGDGDPFRVGAGIVIAADGATSRIRRTAGVASAPIAYAVRQYFSTEKPLEPIFDCYVPLEVDGTVLPGYGWVFPLDAHTANVGLGFYREPGDPSPPLTGVLRAFVTELRTKASRRFGQLEEIGQPLGAPVGVRLRDTGERADGLLFAGDSAGTTHPMTGEGIAFAMRHGEAVAHAAHAHSKNGTKRSPASELDRAVRRFPQLGGDYAIAKRLWMRSMNGGKAVSSSPSSEAEPYLETVAQMMIESAYDTSASGTPAWQALSEHGGDLGVCLERANDALLESLVCRMPFVTEVIHGATRSHLGPMYAAVTIGVAADGGAVGLEAALDAAIAAESVGVLPKLLTMLVDRARSPTVQLNNTLAVLTGDFAATRALIAAARLGIPAVTALAAAGQRGCEGGMRDSSARFDASRSVECWFRAARETAGAATVLATQLGTVVRGGDAEIGDALESYATELGIAIRLAEEIADLLDEDSIHQQLEGADLRRGTYPLPVLFAAQSDAQLNRMLVRFAVGSCGISEFLAAVHRSGGIERAVEECASRSRAARLQAESLPGPESEVLASLAIVPAAYVGVEDAAHAEERIGIASGI